MGQALHFQVQEVDRLFMREATPMDYLQGHVWFLGCNLDNQQLLLRREPRHQVGRIIFIFLHFSSQLHKKFDIYDFDYVTMSRSPDVPTISLPQLL